MPVAVYAESTTLFGDFVVPEEKDLSLALVGIIFGDLTDANNRTAIGVLMGMFNRVALLLGLCVIAYYVIYFTLTSAVTGSFIGQNDSPMVMMRVLLGLFLLIGSPTGFSIAQHLVYEIIKGGAGFGTLVWKKSMDVVYGAESTTSLQSDWQVMNEYEPVIRAVVGGVACTLAINYKSGSGGGNYKKSVYKKEFERQGNDDIVPDFSELATEVEVPNNGKLTGELAEMEGKLETYKTGKWLRPYLGKYKVDGSGNDYSKKNRTFEDDVLKTGGPELDKSRLCFGIPDSEYGCGFSTTSEQSNVAPCGAINVDGKLKDEAVNLSWNLLEPLGMLVAGEGTSAQIQSKIKKVIKTFVGKMKSTTEERSTDFTKLGWATAGFRYSQFSIAKYTPQFKIFSPTTQGTLAFEKYTSGHKSTALTSAVNSFTSKVKKSATCGNTDGTPLETINSFTDLIKPISHAPSSDLGKMIGGLASTYEKIDQIPDLACEDPIQTKVEFGDSLMKKATYILISLITVFTIILLITNWCGAALPIPQLFDSLILWTMSILVVIISVIFVQGALLAIVLPLIPLLAFVGGVICWLLAVVEAMIAAPLVALGIMWPGSGHQVFGRAEPVLHTLLQIFLRPALMVVALLVGVMICWLGIYLVDMAFAYAINITLIQTEDISRLLMISTVKVYLYVAIARRAFTLIYELPDRVFSWIGAHVQSYGRLDEFIMPLQRGVEEGAQEVTSLANRVVGATGQGMKESRSRRDAKENKNDGDKSGAEGTAK